MYTQMYGHRRRHIITHLILTYDPAHCLFCGHNCEANQGLFKGCRWWQFHPCWSTVHPPIGSPNSTNKPPKWRKTVPVVSVFCVYFLPKNRTKTKTWTKKWEPKMVPNLEPFLVPYKKKIDRNQIWFQFWNQIWSQKRNPLLNQRLPKNERKPFTKMCWSHLHTRGLFFDCVELEQRSVRQGFDL